MKQNLKFEIFPIFKHLFFFLSRRIPCQTRTSTKYYLKPPKLLYNWHRVFDNINYELWNFKLNKISLEFEQIWLRFSELACAYDSVSWYISNRNNFKNKQNSEFTKDIKRHRNILFDVCNIYIFPSKYVLVINTWYI